jgi:SulP family sulfate permease
MRTKALPLLPTLHGYQGSWLVPDLTAGLTLVAIAIPEQIATAHLASMPAVAGLYAFVAGSVLFALLGRHPQMSVGADSTIAPVFAAGVVVIATTRTSAYPHLVNMTALLVGALLVVAGLLRLGWVADFFPLPVVTGVLAGIGVDILVHQLPTVLGLPGGGTTTIGRIRAVIDQIGKVNGWALGIAAAVLCIVVIAERVDGRIPGALLGVIGATAVVGLAGLPSRGVKVVGTVQAGVPRFGWPSASLHQVGSLMAMAVTVAFLCVVQTSATSRLGPSGAADRPEHLNMDLAAVGAGSLLAGFAGSFAVDASPPRTAVVGSAGGRSQVSGLVAVLAIVAVLAFATSLLKNLPEAALGAILVFVASRLFHLGEFRRVLSFSWFEFALMLLTVVVVVLVGVEQGVVAAALIALAQRTRLAARPVDAVLGREPGTDHWIQTDIGRPTEQVAGVLVYLLFAPLWYANVARVTERIRRAVAAASPVQLLVLDANGMSDVDYTGAKTLGEMVNDLHQAGTVVAVARASHLVHHDLRHAGVLALVGPQRFFPSVEEAVSALARAGQEGAVAGGAPLA